MNKNWQQKKIGEVALVFYGNSINKKVKDEKYSGIDEGLPYIATKDVAFDCASLDYENGIRIPLNEKGFKLAKKNSVLICAEGGSAGKKIGYTEQDVCFGNKLFAVESRGEVLPKFLYYYFLSPAFKERFKERLGGLIGGIPMRKFKDIIIKYPNLDEQKRLIDKFDNIFDFANEAKSCISKIDVDLGSIFRSYCESLLKQGAMSNDLKKVGDILSLEYGKPLDSELRDPSGKYPVYGANGIKTRTDEFYFDGKSIIVGRKGSAGELTFTEDRFWPLDVTYFVKPHSNKYDLEYIYYLLLSLNLPGLAKGVKPGINRNDVYNLEVYCPDLETQKKIAGKIKLIEEYTNELVLLNNKKFNKTDHLLTGYLQEVLI